MISAQTPNAFVAPEHRCQQQLGRALRDRLDSAAETPDEAAEYVGVAE